MKKRWMVFQFWIRSTRVVLASLVALCLAAPALAQTGNSPWENAVNVLQQAFTSTIARGLSLVAIVVSGLTFAFARLKQTSATRSMSSSTSNEGPAADSSPKSSKSTATTRTRMPSISALFMSLRSLHERHFFIHANENVGSRQILVVEPGLKRRTREGLGSKNPLHGLLLSSIPYEDSYKIAWFVKGEYVFGRRQESWHE